MKTPFTLTLAASIFASSLPAAAQFPYAPPPRYQPPPQYMPPPITPVSSDWTRVRAIEPRSQIRVAAVGLGDRDHQYFVSASDRTLTLLVVGDLPRAARRLVIGLAGSHPDLFMVPEKWMEFSDGRIRVNPDGLFVGHRKVADLSDFAKTIDAGDVAEVAAEMTVPRPLSRGLGDPPSALVPVAFVASLYGTLAICKNKCGSEAVLSILGVPLVVGLIAARHNRHAMQLVYRVR
jgi:hypothetical protein